MSLLKKKPNGPLLVSCGAPFSIVCAILRHKTLQYQSGLQTFKYYSIEYRGVPLNVNLRFLSFVIKFL